MKSLSVQTCYNYIDATLLHMQLFNFANFVLTICLETF